MFRRVLLLIVFFAGNIFNLLACPFCNDLDIYGQTYRQLYSGVAMEKDMILMQSDNFYVISDNYPVACGHLLIVPKVHITSFASINSDWSVELAEILSKLKMVFNTTKYILFEHGCRLNGETVISSGNSVYHAHLHFIPNMSINECEIKGLLSAYGLVLKNESIVNTALDYLGDETLLPFLKQETECFVDGNRIFKSYLFLKYSDDKAFVISENAMVSKVPSQFFRKVLAVIANGGEAFWDWKKPLEVGVLKTLRDRLAFVWAKFNGKTGVVTTCAN